MICVMSTKRVYNRFKSLKQLEVDDLNELNDTTSVGRRTAN